MKPSLIEFSNKGLYCPQGKFYIDPFKPVERALITHAHGDHSRFGMKYYLAHNASIPIMKFRLGPEINCEGVEYGEVREMNGVKISYHPAGHIIGSSQIRLEYKGEVWVISGDYKLENDGISTPFESIKCHSFITESTFGLPIYKWRPQSEIFEDMNGWWQMNKEKGKASIVFAYSLGKAQRILHNLDKSIGPIYLHGAIYYTNKAFNDAGIPVGEYPIVDTKSRKDIYRDALIIAPPGWASSSWMKRFLPYSTGVASGWMALRGTKKRKAADKGFALSDHADWPGLNEAVLACEAERVFVTHGYTNTFANWLQSKGIEASIVNTLYESQFSDDEGENTVEETDNDSTIKDIKGF
jgi:putative mRNA 3-end processing factor